MQNRGMPVTQQMPDDARDAELLGSWAQNVFEQIVGSKGPCPARVQKNPSVLFGLRPHCLKRSELRKLGSREPDGTATSVRFWRIDFAIAHRLSDPQALMFPVDRFPAQSQQLADADSGRTAEPDHRSVRLFQCVLKSLQLVVCRQLRLKPNWFADPFPPEITKLFRFGLISSSRIPRSSMIRMASI